MYFWHLKIIEQAQASDSSDSDCNDSDCCESDSCDSDSSDRDSSDSDSSESESRDTDISDSGDSESIVSDRRDNDSSDSGGSDSNSFVSETSDHDSSDSDSSKNKRSEWQLKLWTHTIGTPAQIMSQILTIKMHVLCVTSTNRNRPLVKASKIFYITHAIVVYEIPHPNIEIVGGTGNIRRVNEWYIFVSCGFTQNVFF